MYESLSVKKIKHMLIEISVDEDFIEFIKNSEFDFQYEYFPGMPESVKLRLLTAPNIFKKNYIFLDGYVHLLHLHLKTILPEPIDDIKITPDYDKLVLLNNEIIPVETNWKEINGYQKRLIENLYQSRDSIDYANIGNTSRTIMNKLANEIFEPDKHIPKDSKIDVSNGKFKNQLITFIDFKLSGSENKEFRRLGESAIEFVQSSIDMMNKITHKHNSEIQLAEICVISTISAVSIIKTINDLK